MWRIFHLVMLFFMTLFASLFSLSISNKTANLIADRIWKNECNGSVSGLTHWNKGESFPSLGIGHFIWYPDGVKDCFKETFPELLLFLKDHNTALPQWIETSKGCPWNSREVFYRDFHTPLMSDLRRFLFESRKLQAQFMVKRLEIVLSDILTSLPQEERSKMTVLINDLTSTPNGLYALIDYLNFKGSGLALKESYQGYRWGLLQVLQKIAARNVVDDFVHAAKEVLETRVDKAPPDKDEKRWLPGWFNRLDTYLEN